MGFYPGEVEPPWPKSMQELDTAKLMYSLPAKKSVLVDCALPQKHASPKRPRFYSLHATHHWLASFVYLTGAGIGLQGNPGRGTNAGLKKRALQGTSVVVWKTLRFQSSHLHSRSDSEEGGGEV